MCFVIICFVWMSAFESGSGGIMNICVFTGFLNDLYTLVDGLISYVILKLI